ncbi:centrosomal protein of 85 kDa-like [Aplochiton taeniatus]
MKTVTMWSRSDFEDGFDSFKTGSSSSSPGWVPGCDPSWQGTNAAPGNSNRVRRHSAASDSGDTGIGTSCSDSVEDQSSSSTTPSSSQAQAHLQPQQPGLVHHLPTAHVMPSPSPGGASVGGAKLGVAAPCGASPWSSASSSGAWSSLTRLTAGGCGGEKAPSSRAGPGYRGPSDPHGSLDRGLLYGFRQDPLGGANAADLYLPSSSSSSSSVALGLLLRSPGADPRYRYDPSAASRTAGRSAPLKPSSLDLGYSALPESRAGPPGAGGVGGHCPPAQRGLPLGHTAVGGSPIQPAVRTQMWLSEQMEYRPGSELGGGGGAGRGAGSETCGGPAALSPWQQEQAQRERLRQEAELNQMLAGASLPVNTLVKIKEGLLRQRELEIDRQKQQILQLHARIRENELRAQQVLQGQRGHCDEPYLLQPKDSPYDSPAAVVPPTQPSDRPTCCEGGELGRKLAAAELEVLRLNEFLKQNTQKYSEDIKKLEEKMKTRDRYISSLKKKCQRESEQNLEKQQRIETLEKYLADLPSLDEVQSQAQQLVEVQQKSQALEETVSALEQRLSEERAVAKEKDTLIETQSLREKELMAAVHSLQQKVEQCLEDGVRLPMIDLKQMEGENTRLVEQQEHSSLLIANQKKQIDRLTQDLTTMERKLNKQKVLTQEIHSQLLEKDEDLATLSRTLHENHRQVEEGVLVRPLPQVQVSEAGPLLKEMSLCLLDLKALCSILSQRAQGQEPNLALLLGIKSMSVTGEENDHTVVAVGSDAVEDLRGGGMPSKLQEVGQLRRDIDELRTAISDRYAQDMGENCVTQ